ncbi:hypothetical protein F0562_003700 [Nyssa sinensis]|uniref:Uncharacterized protein n=1 Tax=Nyssa sinensis TaxID=561372 RepID=A0A5J5BXS5_9ASTE|nr:hypothetical protein F0562_003700 [Nyssa sinensis]
MGRKAKANFWANVNAWGETVEQPLNDPCLLCEEDVDLVARIPYAKDVASSTNEVEEIPLVRKRATIDQEGTSSNQQGLAEPELPEQDKDNIPPTGNVTEKAEGVRLSRPTLVTTIGELCELIQFVLLFKRVSIVDVSFLSSRVSLSPEKATIESLLSISSDNSPDMGEKDLVETIIHRRATWERSEVKRFSTRPQPIHDRRIVQPCEVLRVGQTTSLAEVVREFLLYTTPVGSKAKDYLSRVENDGQASQQEIVLTKAVGVGNVSEVAAIESILAADVPREEVRKDTVPGDGVPFE